MLNIFVAIDQHSVKLLRAHIVNNFREKYKVFEIRERLRRDRKLYRSNVSPGTVRGVLTTRF